MLSKFKSLCLMVNNIILPFHKVSPLLVPKMCDQHGTSAQSVRAFHYFRTIPLQPISKVDVYKINYKYTALVTRHYWSAISRWT